LTVIFVELPPNVRNVRKSTNVRFLPKLLWLILALFALENALGALCYLLPNVPFPAELDNFTQRRIVLSLHALGGTGGPGAMRCEESGCPALGFGGRGFCLSSILSL